MNSKLRQLNNQLFNGQPVFLVMPGNNVAVNTEYLVRSVNGVTAVQPRGPGGMRHMPVQTAVLYSHAGVKSSGYELTAVAYADQADGVGGPYSAYRRDDPLLKTELRSRGDQLENRPSPSEMPVLAIPTATRTMTCEIPPGIGPGGAFNVQTPEGNSITVRPIVVIIYTVSSTLCNRLSSLMVWCQERLFPSRTSLGCNIYYLFVY